MIDGNDNEEPLPGASVYWVNADNGTSTDREGKFEIARLFYPSPLIISFTGYITDTLIVDKKADNIRVVLQPLIEEIDEVVINAERKVTTYNKLEIIDTETIAIEGIQILA